MRRRVSRETFHGETGAPHVDSTIITFAGRTYRRGESAAWRPSPKHPVTRVFGKAALIAYFGCRGSLWARPMRRGSLMRGFAVFSKTKTQRVEPSLNEKSARSLSVIPTMS